METLNSKSTTSPAVITFTVMSLIPKEGKFAYTLSEVCANVTAFAKYPVTSNEVSRACPA